MRHALPRTTLMLLLATPVLFAAAQDPFQSKTTYSRAQAQARAIGNVSVVLRPSQLSFDFGGASRASLSPKGEWNVEARVHHNGLLCADYSVGVRFGIGRPGCSNVAWLTDVTYVTNQRQCNNATVEHSGGDVQPRLEDSFTQISCAERVTRCVGLCK
jgi:hypothetical protein